MGGIVEPRENDTQTVTRERGTLIAVTVCSRVFLRLASLATRKEDLARRLTKSLLAFEQKKKPLEITSSYVHFGYKKSSFPPS